MVDTLVFNATTRYENSMFTSCINSLPRVTRNCSSIESLFKSLHKVLFNTMETTFDVVYANSYNPIISYWLSLFVQVYMAAVDPH